MRWPDLGGLKVVVGGLVGLLLGLAVSWALGAIVYAIGQAVS